MSRTESVRAGALRTLTGFALSAFLCIAAFVQSAAAQSAKWPTNGWATATPEETGLAADALAALHKGIQAGDFGHVDRMVVVHKGRLVTDHRYPQDYRKLSAGKDTTSHQFNYTHPDHHPWYMGRDVHSLQSVTKSVTATLIGVALEKGHIEGIGAPLLSFFSRFDLSGVDPRLRRANLEDLLTMRTGIEWHEQDRPIDSTNTTIQLEASNDWIRFTLSQPMDAAPGEKWVYNSGGSHLMSGVIKTATGEFVDTYAEKHLFSPLGIDEYHWKKTPQGYPDTEGGLYLEARDLAKIGYLYLKNGVWEGQRILPAGWVEAATAKLVENVNRAGFGYGYQWWRVDVGESVVWAGLGYGGQYLLVLPQHELVGVVNCWNLFDRPAKAIFPAFRAALITAGNASSSSLGSPGTDGLEKLKSLAGTWHGKTPDGKPLVVTYETQAGGSIVIETRKPEKEPSMISVFHLDGESLMMTHYCSIGNQPRMRAGKPAAGVDLQFAYLDATNMPSAEAGHMHGLTFRFESDKRIEQVWTWRENGEDKAAPFLLERR